MHIRKFIIEDVRCFAGRQEFNIRPLTFLVGENSTGKSTALGCFQTLHTFTNPRPHDSHLDFNVEPYQMGTFADIVRKSNPRKRSFRFGFEYKSENKGESVEYILRLVEKEKGSEPVVQEQRVILSKGELVFIEGGGKIDGPNGHGAPSLDSEISESIGEGGFREFVVGVNQHRLNTNISSNLSYMVFEAAEKRSTSPEEKDFYNLVERLPESLSGRRYGPYEESPCSFAPVRSKPQRTYDPLKETISPEGSDIPMVLMNMFRTNEEKWKELKGRLIEFGKSSGLFSDIHVRRLGKSMGDPFQLQIKVKGPKVNMIDVGYGVNQLLPILVRMFEAHEKTTFLMQQPEVHLHPRGQAELSSLFTDLVKQRRHNFVIETHSDAMINRARIEIMNKRIAPEDVSLIYLEPSGNSVKVHNIRFDEQANLLDVPNGYRDFFLNESDKLLGFIEG